MATADGATVSDTAWPKFFRIRTYHATIVCQLANGAIGHKPARQSRSSEILVCATDPGRIETVWFVNSVTGQPFCLGGERWVAALVPVRRLRLADGANAFAHPYSGRLVIALPEVDGAGQSFCSVSRWRVASGWESFHLEELAPASILVPDRARAAIELLARAKRTRLRSLLLGHAALPDLEAAARLAPQQEFEQLARDVVADTELAVAATTWLSGDPMAIGLANLLATRPGASDGAVDRVNDARFAHLSLPSSDGTYQSFAHKLTSTARRQRLPAKRLCALAIARDEGPYILEWIAYHRCIGVQHFFLYTNDNQDGSDALLSALAREGIVTWIDNTGSIRDMQAKAYAHALTIEPGTLDYEWAAIIDLDEFISLRSGGFTTLQDYIGWQENQPVDVIALSWAVYWSNGNVFWSDDLTLARFNRQNTGSGLCKSIIRPHKFTYAYAHLPAGMDPSQPVVVRDGSGAQIGFERGELSGLDAQSAVYGDAWVNHYFSRSAEEFLWKWSRNRSNGETIPSFAEVPHGFVNEFVQNHRVRHLSVPDGVAGRLAAVHEEMAALLRLPSIAAAQERIIAYRKAQAVGTRQILGRIERLGLSEAHRAFLDLLEAGERSAEVR